MSASSVEAARPANQQARDGASPILALQPKEIELRPISSRIARFICEQHHYLHSYPASSLMNIGIFHRQRLLGVCVVGCGPSGIKHMFANAEGRDIGCLSRLWLDDILPKNSESRVLSVLVRQLRRNQSVIKALVAYSDPAAGHDGTIYRASGFLYVGKSSSSALYRLPDGSLNHSRTLSHIYGTHSRKYLSANGVCLEPVYQPPKHTYVAIIDKSWRERLAKPVLPYSTINSEE